MSDVKQKVAVTELAVPLDERHFPEKYRPDTIRLVGDVLRLIPGFETARLIVTFNRGPFLPVIRTEGGDGPCRDCSQDMIEALYGACKAVVGMLSATREGGCIKKANG